MVNCLHRAYISAFLARYPHVPTPSLEFYFQRFQKLRVASTRAHGEAPYKPALLLAVIEGIEAGTITENRIEITAELIATFKTICQALSTSTHFTASNFALPFYHLASDGFWYLRTWPGLDVLLTKSHSIRSFGHLREVVQCASLDETLWQLLTVPASREALRTALLQRYFAQTQFRYRPAAGAEALATIRNQMLEEPAAVYRMHATSSDELDTVVRSSVFKRLVLEAYDSTCAVSGLKLLSTRTGTAPLLDACHIVPWALTQDDTLPNGIALCPNLHRAFDRHLFWVDDDYRVQLATNFSELAGVTHGISQFAGCQLHLPKERFWWPQLKNFQNQRLPAY